MLAYIVRRLLLVFPTLFGIMVINFAIVQVAPGGPVERIIAEITGSGVEATARIGGEAGSEVSEGGRGQGGPATDSVSGKYRGAQGLDPEFIKELEKQFGFDKPAHVRFGMMIKSYVTRTKFFPRP